MSSLYKKKNNRENYITLDLNENNFKKKINIENINFNDFAKYPDYKIYRKKFASFYGEIPENNFIFTNGADEGIKLIFESLLNKNDSILIPSPFFSMYEILGNTYSLNLIEIIYRKDFSFPFNEIKKTIEKRETKFELIIITNPNNPTGTLIGKNKIEEIIKLTDKPILIDQTYMDFSEEDCLSLLKKYSNLIIINSFSKLYGLAGLRLGMLFTSNKLLKKIKRFRLPYNVNSAALDIAYNLLKKKDYKKRMLKNYKREKKYLYRNFEKLNINFFKTQTNFVLIKVKKPNTFIQFMKKNGVLVKNIKKEGFKNIIRVTVGKREENITFINLLKKYMKKKFIILDESVFLYDEKFFKKIKIIIYKLTKKEFPIKSIKKLFYKSDLTDPVKLIKKAAKNTNVEEIKDMLDCINRESLILFQMKKQISFLNYLKEKYSLGYLKRSLNVNPPGIFDYIFTPDNLPDKNYLILTKASLDNQYFEKNKICYVDTYSRKNDLNKKNSIGNIAEGGNIYEKINS